MRGHIFIVNYKRVYELQNSLNLNYKCQISNQCQNLNAENLSLEEFKTSFEI